MTDNDTPSQPLSIEDVRNQFDQWRQARQKRTRIPENLWQMAIALTERHSVNKISKTLRLNSADFKKRIQQLRPDCLPNSVEPTVQPGFFGFEIAQSNTTEFMVEIRHRNGATLKAQMKGAHLDLIEMSRIFLGAGE